MLKAEALSREVVFSSTEAIKELKLRQVMYLHDQLVETLEFDFPFVIPGTTNTWEQVIVADTKRVMPPEILSGNLRCETYFLSYNTPIHKTEYKIFYD